RQLLQSVINGFLSTLLERRALFDFATDVSENNNTPETIQAGELHAEVAIKITPSAKFIYIDLTPVNLNANIGGRN
ncbi:MAG: hypothetical protein AABY22_07010, partial [Nanoarchaeota archaeon]